MGAVGAGEYQRQPGGAVFEIVQRLRIGHRRIRMIDPLHDLPGRGRGAAGDRRGIAARADRSARSAGRQRSCRPASRTARPSARHRPACASRHRLAGAKSAASRRSSVTDVIRQVAPGRRSVVGPEIATWPAAKPNGCFGLRAVSGQPRSGNRSIPSVDSRASAAATLRPAMTRSGAISASGTSTKARSNSRGCGSVSSGLSIETSS